LIRYLDICSGISAPTMAWKPLGWKALCFAEIEAAPRAVLSHHYPNVPLNGDFTKIEGTEYGPVDLLVGGTPCQSFSVAGLRGGLADERGNLALEYLRLADRARPRWVVWENVPGVLSSSGGRDFGTFLGGLAQLGYGFAYRVLDAQFFGVPQRRRRVFVVGYLGDWRRAAAVLFERHSLSGNPAPRREAGKVAPTMPSRSSAGGGLGTDFDCDGGLLPEIVGALNSAGGHARPGDTLQCAMAGHMLAFGGNNTAGPIEIATACNAHAGGSRHDFESEPFVATAFQTSGNSGAWETGSITGALDTNTDPNSHVVCFSAKDHGADAQHNLSPTLRAGGHSGSHANAGVMPAVALMENQRAEIRMSGQTDALACGGGKPGQGYAATFTGSAVRRLTPRECERLQGFPDDFTLVPYRNGMMADGPRYKALGNSMAVPVVRWIGERIQAVEAIAAAMSEAA
jgi:DNA (cytosine-5)-methyltransferase 1